jgi:signal transduction histidine kinase
VFTWQFRNVKKDGTIIWVEEYARMVPGPDGTPQVLVVSQDITERRQFEEALSRATKKLNLLNYITLTDIENAIFSLSGYLELEKMSPVDENMRELLEKQTEIVRIIAECLKFSRHYQSLGLHPPTWQSVMQVFLFGISHLDYSKLSRNLEVQGLEIYADQLLENVFLAMSENVVLHGETATDIRLFYRETSEGLILVFQDNGVGIPKDQKEKIFEKKHVDKKGMGLFLTREILSITGITIVEVGEPGKGACFEISVPKGAYRFE